MRERSSARPTPLGIDLDYAICFVSLQPEMNSLKFQIEFCFSSPSEGLLGC